VSRSSIAAKATVGTLMLFRKLFSSTRSWATARARGPGATSAAGLDQNLDRPRRHVLELEGDGLAGLAQHLQRGGIVIGGDDLALRHAEAGAVFLGVEDDDIEAQTARRPG
jgi:hypothetical protein